MDQYHSSRMHTYHDTPLLPYNLILHQKHRHLCFSAVEFATTIIHFYLLHELFMWAGKRRENTLANTQVDDCARLMQQRLKIIRAIDKSSPRDKAKARTLCQPDKIADDSEFQTWVYQNVTSECGSANALTITPWLLFLFSKIDLWA